MAGVQKPVLNAIRSVAFLLEEMEESQINSTVKEAFDSQITEFTSDMKLLIEDAREKIDMHLKTSEEKVNQLINNAMAQPRQTHQSSYASALIAPPPHANPRVAAREGIKARQFMLEGMDDTRLAHMDNVQLKLELNKILLEAGLEKGKIRSVVGIRNRGSLVEMDSDEAAAWFQKTDNRSTFCQKIGPKVESRTRLYNLIAMNVPLTYDADDQSHLSEILEVNNLDKETISATRWAKPVDKRSPEQRTAHLLLSFRNADAANRSITNGIYICNKRCYVEKVKKEPTRCLKCQGWNHFAKDCPERDDTCSNCAGNHRTKECQTPHAKRCVSCKKDDHASWSRDCPTFLKKVDELNERLPENALQYIPTADPWTWTATEKRPSPPPAPLPKVNFTQDRSYSQRMRKTRPATRTFDTYIPAYDDLRPRERDMAVLDTHAQENLKDLMDSRPFNQQSLMDLLSEVPDSNHNPPVPS